MAAETQFHSEPHSELETHHDTEITVCESAPGKYVFLESGNTDGWIATDATVDVTR
ncbi:hypothetical protein ACH9L7_18270 (plasmid) [Haloferax sp. S1W]|uniref:hypothetical protein n=1 Tax=Haloferax sp. S1W TaxID=3377110 RepID=UPI0037C7B3FC